MVRDGARAPPHHEEQLPALQRHHDLAEMLVGFHVRERRAHLVELVDLVDRQLQLARFHGAPDVFADFVKISRISSMERVRKVTPI